MGKASNERKRRLKQEAQKRKVRESIDTVEQAINFLIERLDEETIDAMKVGSLEDAENDASYYHRGLGMFIRNAFGLWKDNVNLRRSVVTKICFPI